MLQDSARFDLQTTASVYFCIIIGKLFPLQENFRFLFILTYFNSVVLVITFEYTYSTHLLYIYYTLLFFGMHPKKEKLLLLWFIMVQNIATPS
jgi:hypothetical protein